MVNVFRLKLKLLSFKTFLMEQFAQTFGAVLLVVTVNKYSSSFYLFGVGDILFFLLDWREKFLRFCESKKDLGIFLQLSLNGFINVKGVYAHFFSIY